MGRLLGRVGYLAFRQRRELALRNVDFAFGDALSDSEKRRIVRGTFENVCIVGLEFSHTPTLLSPKNKRLVDVRGFERVDRTKGAIFTCAHLANWEWMASPIAAMGTPIAEVVNAYRNPSVERALNSVRQRAGVLPVSKHGTVSRYFDLLSKGMLVGIVSDQSPRKNGVPVTMFDRDCWATPGPAILSLKAGVPVHHATIWRKQDGNYVMDISQSIPFEPTENVQQDIHRLTQKIQDHIEESVRAHPEQWLWTHNRWKARPDAAKEWNGRQVKNAERSQGIQGHSVAQAHGNVGPP